MGLLIFFSALALMVGIPAWLEARRKRRLKAIEALWTPQAEACWSEAVAMEGQLSFGRYQCVNDELMEMDRRASRGDFPVLPSY